MRRFRSTFAALAVIPVLAGVAGACAPPTGGGGGGPICYNGDMVSGVADFAVTGPIGAGYFSFKNVTFYTSDDGTCTTPFAAMSAVVTTSDPLAACTAVDPASTATSDLDLISSNAPANMFLCSGTSDGGVLAPGTCYDYVGPVGEAAGNDIAYSGPPNSIDNATVFASTDGTCSGVSQLVTVVQHSNSTAASLMCTTLITSFAIGLGDRSPYLTDLRACV